jgi:lipid-A-disaccharide synthase
VPETHAFLIAGETSGDQLAAELVQQWRLRRSGLRFSGAGGPAMAAAGVQLSVDLTTHSVIGLWEVIRRYRTFRRLFHQLLDQCVAERPDIVVGIDYGGFNLRFATALRERTRGTDWNPRIVQYVSPQVWASRPGRARRMETTHDLLLSILPFEKDWYARNAPNLQVEFVGHPIVERHAGRSTESTPALPRQVLLLPGSRVGELQRHLPVLLETARRIRTAPASADIRARLILPNARLVDLARSLGAGRDGNPEPEIGGLPEALQQATLALASTGTVTLECAWFGVPTLALYRTSWLTYQIGRRVITVKYLAMPNLLADAMVMPEFIQSDANPTQLAGRAVQWLSDPAGLLATRRKLRELVSNLGTPGAATRAAGHLEDLLLRPSSQSG